MNAGHLIHIREALWKRPGRGACVMVGSGLSRQTDPSSPTWGDLAVRLQQKLQWGAEDGPRTGHTSDPVTAVDCPRLAQEYEEMFGRPELDKFLLSEVPDGEPGEVHRRLLSLPWADVFTTNWDTLLERAARNLSDRKYGVVAQRADLSTADAPRIVKLHGSFPSIRPFVVTEEDYGNYSALLAPFENTIRQALMESVFVLVGFSGDDPNFRNWCGWVRNQLGTATPRLYFAGLLDPQNRKLRPLEELGVIPIDLPSEMSGAPSSDVAHEWAIEWVLGGLAAGEIREQSWPISAPRRTTARGKLPLPPPPTAQPRREPEPPSTGSDQAALKTAVLDIVEIWKHNRRVYPSWPILPFSKHQALHFATERWIKPMLQVISTLDPDCRLVVMRELIWRLELLMDPLLPSVVVAAKEAFEATEADPGQAGDLGSREQEETKEARVAVALALLTNSRHDLDHAGSGRWRQALESMVALGSEAFHRLQHERCLWALIEANFPELTEILGAWRTENADPMWSFRKVALLVESGNFADGKCLVLQTLQRTERAWAREACVKTASRFGWALYWRRSLDMAQWWEDVARGSESALPDSNPWAPLAPHDADARSDWHAYARQLTRKSSENRQWTFDLRRVHSFHVATDGAEKFRAAWRVIRLVELAGLPSKFRGVVIARDEIKEAANILAPWCRTYVVRLLLSGSTGDEKAFDGALEQLHVARMPDCDVAGLFSAAQLARDFFLGRLTGAGTYDDLCATKLVSATETMSRCLTRYGVDGAVETFRWAVQYRHTEPFPGFPFLKSVNRLVQRSWNAMNPAMRRSVIRDILLAPIPADALPLDEDPGVLLVQESLEIERGDVEKSTWAESVDRICVALRDSAESRGRAVGRLQWIVGRRLLIEAEEREVARSLWASASQETSGLPVARGVDDWVYLALPELEPGMAERRFRTKWIGRDIKEATGDTGGATIRNVAIAWNPAHTGDNPIPLSADEIEWFWTFATAWLDHERRARPGIAGDGAMVELAEVLIRRGGPKSVLDGLVKNTEPVEGGARTFAGLFGRTDHRFLVIAACAALGAGDGDEMEGRLRTELRSTDEGMQFAAGQALRWWIANATLVKGVRLNAPSLECVREIGLAIGRDDEDGGVGPLMAACAVYESGNSNFLAAIHPTVLRGLRRLRSDLDYEKGVVGDALPIARHWCVGLALTMTDAGMGDDDIVREWIKEGDEDPLCLVRFVRERYEASRKTRGGAADR